ncbi:hypothetical protein [Algibacter sp. 2305UL17-15]|uniref:hypothetical protein n=1 Tax=Algibacter sp. 2305UL17-15 TaxID=3231268 RepID=UPI003458CB2C
MEEKPVKIEFIKKKGDNYLIKFPYLKIPVSVNDDLYVKMLNSSMYEFVNLPKQNSRVNSA